jgi:hypothetical protein
MNKLVFVLIMLFHLSSCSSPKDVNSVYFKHFNFSGVQTYSTFDRNTGFRTNQSMTDSKRNQIELAIDKSMQALGLSYTDKNSADLIVSYAVVGTNHADYIAYNKAVRFCFSCIQSSTWVSTNENWDVKLGSLVIDFIDPKSNRSVWRNIYPLDVEVEDNSREVNVKINEAVKVMISKYPDVKVRG